MLAATAAVLQDVGTVAASIFEGVSQDRHSVERAVVVDLLSKTLSGRRQPDRIGDHRPKRIPDDVA
jgi:hypothetical protein